MTDLLGPASDNSVTTRPARTIVRGSTDTWFQDCTSPDANDGTVFPADYFNDVLAQVRTALRDSGITLDGADDMLWRAMQSIGLRYGTDIGSAGHIQVTFATPVAALGTGLAVLVKLANDIAGATDFAPNGLTAKSIKWPDGSALTAGDGKAGGVMLLVYDGTVWQLMNYVSRPGTGGGGSAHVPGEIIMWPLETPQTGTLECNGAAVSRTTYANLFTAIGTTHGAGNGTTTFNLPDYRGIFLRGWDHGAGNDPDVGSRTNRGDAVTGDHVGTAQLDSNKSHTHSVTGSLGNFAAATEGGDDHHILSTYGGNANPGTDGAGISVAGTSLQFDLSIVTVNGTAAATGGTESRPKNKTVMFCIAF